MITCVTLSVTYNVLSNQKVMQKYCDQEKTQCREMDENEDDYCDAVVVYDDDDG